MDVVTRRKTQIMSPDNQQSTVWLLGEGRRGDETFPSPLQSVPSASCSVNLPKIDRAAVNWRHPTRLALSVCPSVDQPFSVGGHCYVRWSVIAATPPPPIAVVPFLFTRRLATLDRGQWVNSSRTCHRPVRYRPTRSRFLERCRWPDRTGLAVLLVDRSL